jgi:hypothetical protein
MAALQHTIYISRPLAEWCCQAAVTVTVLSAVISSRLWRSILKYKVTVWKVKKASQFRLLMADDMKELYPETKTDKVFKKLQSATVTFMGETQTYQVLEVGDDKGLTAEYEEHYIACRLQLRKDCFQFAFAYISILFNSGSGESHGGRAGSLFVIAFGFINQCFWLLYQTTPLF